MTQLKATEPIEQLSERIEQLIEKLSVDAVFGQPVIEGDVTLIPVADVTIGFGFGTGPSPASEEEEETDRGKSEGGGSGGKATPRGYIKITPDGVDFESTLDEGRVALAGIAMVAWAIFWVTKAIRVFARN